jgi:hypothetical protein
MTDYGDKYLLTFNEPDDPTQSNMTVARALQLWPQLEETGLQLSSPAVTTQGQAWLAAFMAGARADAYRVNFIAAHWYGDCSNPENLVTYLNGMEATYGLPIWLTEFSCANDSRNECDVCPRSRSHARRTSVSSTRGVVYQPSFPGRIRDHELARHVRCTHVDRKRVHRLAEVSHYDSVGP